MSAMIASLFMGLASLVSGPQGEFRAAASTLTAEDVLAHIRVLASDAFEGRGPGTAGRGQDG